MLDKISWMNARSIRIRTAHDWNKKIHSLMNSGPRVTESKTDLGYWACRNSWNFDKDRYGNYTIYVSYPKGHDDPFLRYEFNINGDLHQDEAKPTGRTAVRVLEDAFEGRTNVTRQYAFGRIDIKDFLGFQYTAITWTDSDYCWDILEGYYKADVSAAYPYQACKMLPDSHGSKRLHGRIKPNEEYPFAFYIKSNQLAIYGEFDTRDYVSHPLNHLFIDIEKHKRQQEKSYGVPYSDRLHYVEVPESEEITILMKKSDYDFGPEFSMFYLRRKEDEKAKAACNMFIGCLGSAKRNINKGIPQRHITSVIYARHLIRMMETFNKIEKNGGKVISVVTDSICWLSPKNFSAKISEKKKYLGGLFLEYENTKACYHSHGVYAIEGKDDAGNKDIKILHQGIKLNSFARSQIKKVQDIRKILDIDGAEKYVLGNDGLFYKYDNFGKRVEV